MKELEQAGLLDRDLEFLPSDAELAERQKQGVPLTRPELAVLLAYSKIHLTAELIGSAVPDDPYFAATLAGYFPATMRERFGAAIAEHRLRREIIATEIANKVINRGGSTMVVRLKEETGRGGDEIALAFSAAEAVFDLEALYAKLDALDNKIDGQFQIELYMKVQNLLRQQTAWFLRHLSGPGSLSEQIELYRAGLRLLRQHAREILTEPQRKRLAQDQDAYAKLGLPSELARQMATLAMLADVPDAIHVAEAVKRPVVEIAIIFSQAITFFRIGELRRATDDLAISDYFDRLAVNSLQAVLSAGLRAVVQDVVREAGDSNPSFDAWREAKGASVERALRGINESLDAGDLTLSRLTVAVTHLRDLVPV